MLYENYRVKMMKLKEVLNVLWRFRILIFSVLAVIIASLAGFMGVYGMVYDVTPNTANVVYGQGIGYSAGAIFGTVRYEYAVQGTDDWSDTYPVNVGDYKVRAVSRNIFGGDRYGAEYAFTIAPKATDVLIDAQSVKYGVNPPVIAELGYSDSIECTKFIYEDITSTYTSVMADVRYVHIYNDDGNDVTANYALRAVEQLISFEKREINITVQDKSGIYDGEALTFDGYELDADTPLAEGDKIIATFDDSITQVGETENVPEIKIVHEQDGKTFDVTVNYTANIAPGKLTIERRPVYIGTPGGEKIYDGTPLTLSDGYALDEDSTLVEGHSLVLTGSTSVTDVGEKRNILTFSVLDADNGDVSDNYSIFLNAGTLKILPRPITFVTAANSWEYDGQAHSDGDHSVAEDSLGLVKGHKSSSSELTEIIDVGETDNEMTITIADSDGVDKTKNYDISYEYGMLSVTPRPITFVTATNSWTYDGQAHSDGNHSVASDSLGLIEGHKSSSSELTEIIDVGEVDNEMTITIADSDGVDKTNNYDISYEYGALTVTPRPITFVTATNSWTYDGQAHSDGNHSVADDSLGLVEGQKSSSSELTEITDVGEAENVMVITIADAEGVDKTANYDISYEYGTLTITRRPISIIAGSAEKEYDGTPLTCDDFTVTSSLEWALVEGHIAIAETQGSQTDVGSGNNEIVSAAIYCGDIDVSANYEISYEVGTLTVTPRPITFVTATNSWEYDGLAHSDGDYSVADDSLGLVTGHKSSSSELTEITDVGEVDNEMTLTIADSEGVDKTANYAISYEYGTLTVTPRPITFVTATNSWEYDGQAHSDGNHSVADDSPGLIDGHRSSSSELTEITDVGEAENVMVITIADSDGVDKTANYAISYEYGALTVTPRPITFVTATNSWTYDGQEHSDGNHSVAEDSLGLVEGQKSSSSELTEITDVGEAENVMVITIADSDGVDKTANYDIRYEYGKLNVTPRPITIIAGSAEKVYDGTPLTCDDFTVTSSLEWALVEGHVAIAETQGSQTDVGSSNNEIVSAAIYCGDIDVSSNYEISYEVGTLTITPRPITFVTATNSWEYDGQAHSDGNHSVAEDSLGLIEGHKSSSSELTEIIDVGETDNVMVITIADSDGVDKTANYAISYEYGTLSVTPRPITFVTATNSWTYDGQAHSDDNHSVASDSLGLIDGHKSSSSELTEITDVGETDNVMTITISDSDGIDKTKNYEISYEYGALTVTPRPITFVTATNSWTYDGQAHSDDNHSVAEDSLGLVAGHKSSSSELAEITDVGETDNEMVITIADAEGVDKTKNYDISYTYGKLNVNPRPITIIAGSAEKEYDGTPLTCDDFTVTSSLEWALVEGHVPVAETQGSQTDVGSSNNEIVSAAIYCGDIDVSSNYEISYEVGTLTITPRQITVIAESITKIYDGKLLSSNKYELDKQGGEPLVSGHREEVAIKGEITDVGECENVITSVRIYDADNNDVTSNYEIYKVNGKLTVQPRPISIVTGSDEWVYDGTAHSQGSFSLSEDNKYGLVNGHKMTSSELTEITDVGETYNEMVITISDSDGVDKTKNYDISYEYGTLSVTPRPITFVTATNSWIYDGQAHSDDNHSVAEDSLGLVKGHKSSSSELTEITDVGKAQNAMVITIADAEGVDKTKNYDISYTYGKLNVTPRPITIIAGSAEKEYDGTPLTCDDFTVTSSLEWALVEGHVAVAETQGSQTDVGSSDNIVISVRIYCGEVDVTSNYEILSLEKGTLTVTPRPVIFVTATHEWIYDGLPHSDDMFRLKEGYSLVDGHKPTASGITQITDVGKTDNVMVITIADSDGVDKTANYKISYEYGELKILIGQLTVTTGDAFKVYDGEACVNGTYSVEKLLADGYNDVNIDIECTGTITDVGTEKNTFTIKVTYGNVDYTEYVRVISKLGTLEVVPRPITVITESKTWEYDGNEHKYEVLHVEEGEYDGKYYGILPTQEYSATDFAAITNPGMKENSCTFAIVDTASGVDVTSNYAITFELGILKVESTGGGQDGNGGKLNTDGSLGLGPVGNESGDGVVFNVMSSQAGQMYFRLLSFGDYNGKGWGQAEEYGELLGGIYSMNYLTGISLGQSGKTAASVEISTYTSDYLLPYYLKMGKGYSYEVQTSDVFYESAIDARTYSLESYMYDYLTEGDIKPMLGEYAAAELAYRQFVKEHYLAVPQSTLAYLKTVIAEKQFSADDPEIIAKVAEYISGGEVASYNLKYDRSLDDQQDIVVSFMRDYHEGVCQHFASAAVLLYRSLGIPARYTIGYSRYMSANEWLGVSGKMAHAWVEVYIDGFGWTEVEVTGAGAAFGGGNNADGRPIELAVKPVDEVKPYDGTPLVAARAEGADDNSKLKLLSLYEKGYSLKAEFSGSQTEIGTSYSEITSVVMVDESGKELDGFRFTLIQGFLTVLTPNVPIITVCPYSLQKVYDGTPLAYVADDYYVEDLPDDWHVEFSLEGISLTDVGVIDYNNFSSSEVKVYDDDNNLLEEGTDYYVNFDKDFSLVVEKRPVTVTSASATKKYDGTPLVNGKAWISSGAIAEGQSFTSTVVGSIVDIGETKNVIESFVITDSNDSDVTDNYEITYNTGKLTVTA